MDWSLLWRWEWLVIESLVLGLAVFELIAVNRSLRRDRQARSSRGSAEPEGRTPAEPEGRTPAEPEGCEQRGDTVHDEAR